MVWVTRASKGQPLIEKEQAEAKLFAKEQEEEDQEEDGEMEGRVKTYCHRSDTHPTLLEQTMRERDTTCKRCRGRPSKNLLERMTSGLQKSRAAARERSKTKMRYAPPALGGGRRERASSRSVTSMGKQSVALLGSHRTRHVNVANKVLDNYKRRQSELREMQAL